MRPLRPLPLLWAASQPLKVGLSRHGAKSNPPIMRDTDHWCVLDPIQTIKNVDDVLGHVLPFEGREVGRLVGSSIPEQIRSDDSVALAVEMLDLVMPVTGLAWEAVQEEEGRLARRRGHSEEVIVETPRCPHVAVMLCITLFERDHGEEAGSNGEGCRGSFFEQCQIQAPFISWAVSGCRSRFRLLAVTSDGTRTSF